jgi:hypothetical protein
MNKDDEEWKDIIADINKESRENDLECLEDARQRKIFRLNKMDIQEAYSELYRVSNHLLDHTAHDIVSEYITVFKNGFVDQIISRKKAQDILGKAYQIDLDPSEIMILNESKHNENIKNIKHIFNKVIAIKPCFELSKPTSFTFENAYEELYKVILIMVRSFMSDVIDYNIIWDCYKHHHRQVKHLPRKRARKIIKKCDKHLSSEIYIPVTYTDQDTNLDFFGKVFKKIRTCPKDCFIFNPENNKRDDDFKGWLS